MKKISELLGKFKDLDPKDLEIFIAEILGKDKAFVLAHPEYQLSFAQFLKLNWFVFQRKQGFSVAAITKHKEFFGLDFYVNKHVLIPRPDTEIMVEQALAEIKQSAKPVILLDVGTGSGCIPISILKNLNKPIPAFATDISGKALKISKKNAKTHGVNINFFQGNLLEPVLNDLSPTLPLKREGVAVTPLLAPKIPIDSSSLFKEGQGEIKIVITANLPYLSEKQFQTELSIQREPKIALVAENNGLALYEELLEQIKPLAQTCHLAVFLEIDPSQTQAITKIIKNALPKANLEMKQDLAGLERLVKINL